MENRQWRNQPQIAEKEAGDARDSSLNTRLLFCIAEQFQTMSVAFTAFLLCLNYE
jgi:hypothetical protein